MSAQLSSVGCVGTLKAVFYGLMMNSDKGLQNRQLRNDLLMICSRIAQLCPDAPFVVSCFNIMLQQLNPVYNLPGTFNTYHSFAFSL